MEKLLKRLLQTQKINLWDDMSNKMFQSFIMFKGNI